MGVRVTVDDPYGLHDWMSNGMVIMAKPILEPIEELLDTKLDPGTWLVAAAALRLMDHGVNVVDFLESHETPREWMKGMVSRLREEVV